MRSRGLGRSQRGFPGKLGHPYNTQSRVQHAGCRTEQGAGPRTVKDDGAGPRTVRDDGVVCRDTGQKWI